MQALLRDEQVDSTRVDGNVGILYGLKSQVNALFKRQQCHCLGGSGISGGHRISAIDSEYTFLSFIEEDIAMISYCS